MLKLRENSLNWALKNINKFNDTYIFPKPFEFDVINENWEEVKRHLLELDVYSEGVRPYRTTVTPKSKLGFRISTQLDPLDSLLYTAIIYELHSEIERARIDKNQNIVYSFRLSPQTDGTLFDVNFNWDSYKERAETLSNEDSYTCVIVTDIADFYPSIYLHNIETALRECIKISGKSAHAETLINIIKAMHLNQTHKGIPVGPQFARPIAELVLDQVDRVLIDNNYVYVRYVDDYIIFCKSEAEAYEKLAYLAQILYDLLNLKLNEQKTKMLDIYTFQEKFIKTSKEVERNSILDKFYELIDELDISRNPYEDIDLDSLSEDEIEKLQEINLVKLLEEELEKEDADLPLITFLLNNLARIDNTDVAEFILRGESISKVYPKLKTIISYLERVRSFNSEQKHFLGDKVLGLLDNSFIGPLEFNRAWILSLFIKNIEWDNEEILIKLLKRYNDDFTKRKLFLALGRAKNIRFFRENKNLTSSLNDWVKRSFIAGISCLPEDERFPWYKARRLINRDFLEKVVEKWAENNHF